MHNTFSPAPNQSILLLRDRYTFPPHPTAPTVPFSAEGKRAIVYRITKNGNEPHALKVFKKRFRTAGLLDSVQRLHRVQGTDGMRAASRAVILPTDGVIQQHPDLMYAMVMPWISGTTWYDLLIWGRQKGPLYDGDTAKNLCVQFLGIMRRMENAGLAHTDIAPGNVVVDSSSGDVQLLDLEDLYGSGLPPLGPENKGTLGYRHPSLEAGRTTYCKEGDRYATAILASEILLLSDPRFTAMAGDSGIFGGDRNSHDAVLRFGEAATWLRAASAEFADLVSRAWRSQSLQECPKLEDLHAAAASVTIHSQTASLRAAVGAAGPIIQWSKEAATVAGHAPAIRSDATHAPAPAATRSSTLYAGWTHAGATPPQTVLPNAPRATSTEVGGWLLFLVVCLTFLIPAAVGISFFMRSDQAYLVSLIPGVCTLLVLTEIFVSVKPTPLE